MSPEMVFRSHEAAGPDGEILLSPVSTECVLQPWRVAEVSDCRALNVTSGDAEIAGLHVTLAKEPGTRGSGWLMLHGSATPIGSDHVLEWAFRNATFSLNDERLDCQPYDPRDSLAETPVGGSVLADHVLLLGQHVVMVKIPEGLDSEKAMTLTVRFPAPLYRSAVADSFKVIENVFPVWNSLPARYPSFQRPAVRMGVDLNRHVHPLTAEALGERWRAWSIGRVGAATDGNIEFPWRRVEQPGHRRWNLQSRVRACRGDPRASSWRLEHAAARRRAERPLRPAPRCHVPTRFR